MLRLLGLLFAVVSAEVCVDDECSFMQQAANLDSSAREARAALDTIKTSMAALNVKDTTRALSMKALMRSVASDESAASLSPSDKDALRNITELLAGVLAGYEQQATEDSSEGSTIVTDATACNDAGDAQHDSHVADVAESKKTLTDCRGDEETKFKADVAACGILTSHMEDVGHLDCHKPDTDNLATTGYSEWDSWFTNGITWFSSANIGFSDMVTNCQATTEAYDAIHGQCDTDQTGYESDFCLYKAFLIEQCSTLNTCYQSATTIHNNKSDRLTPLGAERVSEAKVIEYVICLLNKLIDDETDFDSCPKSARTDEAYNNLYGVNISSGTDIPAKDDCDTSVVQTSPRSADWFSNEYGTMFSHHTESGIDC